MEWERRKYPFILVMNNFWNVLHWLAEIYRIHSIKHLPQKKKHRPWINTALKKTLHHDAVLIRIMDSNSKCSNNAIEFAQAKQFYFLEEDSDIEIDWTLFTLCIAVVLICRFWNWEDIENYFSDKKHVLSFLWPFWNMFANIPSPFTVRNGTHF